MCVRPGWPLPRQLTHICTCMHACTCMCVCEGEARKPSHSTIAMPCTYMHACMCMCVCEAEARRPLCSTISHPSLQPRSALPCRFVKKWEEKRKQYGQEMCLLGEGSEEQRKQRITLLQSKYRSVLLEKYDGEDCLFGPVVNPPDRLLLEVSAIYYVTYQAAQRRQARRYMHACMHACVHTYIHAYIHTYIRRYIYTYMHAYIHTYIHTGIDASCGDHSNEGHRAVLCLGGCRRLSRTYQVLCDTIRALRAPGGSYRPEDVHGKEHAAAAFLTLKYIYSALTQLGIKGRFGIVDLPCGLGWWVLVLGWSVLCLHGWLM